MCNAKAILKDQGLSLRMCVLRTETPSCEQSFCCLLPIQLSSFSFHSLEEYEIHSEVSFDEEEKEKRAPIHTVSAVSEQHLAL